MPAHRLTRNLSDRMVGGVCSGLADYLAIDVTLIRLFFILLALGDGIGVLLYLVLWVAVPADYQEPRTGSGRNAAMTVAEEMVHIGAGVSRTVFNPDSRTKLLVGLVLVIVGVLFLLENLNIPGLAWLDFDLLWPVLLIVGGVVFLIRRGRH